MRIFIIIPNIKILKYLKKILNLEFILMLDVVKNPKKYS